MRARGGAALVAGAFVAGALALSTIAACGSTGGAAERPPQFAHEREDAGESAVLLAQADAAFASAELEDAQQMYAAAAAMAQREDDVSTQVEALAQAGRMMALRGDPAAGHAWLDRAVELARPEDPLGWSRALIARGVFAREEGRAEEARSLFRQAYEYAESQRLHDRALQAAFLLASAGDREHRIEWTRAGIELATDAQLAGWLGPLYSNLAALYMDAEDYDGAVSALEAARSTIAPRGDEESLMITDYAYGVALRKAGRPEDARRAMTAAHRQAQAKLQDLRSRESMLWVGKTLWELAELDLLDGEDERGRERMSEALEDLRLARLDLTDPERWTRARDRAAEVLETEETP